jgi:hypothetical protein
MPAQNKPSTRSQYSAGEISSAASGNISLSKTEDTTRRFNLLKDQVPELGGRVLWNLASSDQPDAMLVATAVRSMDLGQIKSGVEMLKGESIEQQKVKWENMSTAKQQIYLDNGYSVPKESSPWWKSALGTAFSPVKAGLRGIGAVGSAIGETPIGTGLGYIGQGAGWLLNVPNEIYDNAIARPYRMRVDTAGQNQEARLDLAFEEARQNLEKQGVDLTDGEWKYLKWKYVEVNGLKRTQYGYAGANPEESIGARTAFSALPGGGETLRFLDAATQINPIADFVRGIPLAGRLVADPKSENPYDKTERASGSGVSDSVYEMFNNEVKRVSEDEDYNLSPWSSWNRASNGSTMISPTKQVESIDKLRSAGLDGEAFDYALFRAKGRSQDEWLQEVEGVTPDDPQFAEKRLALGQKYEGQETVKEVIGDLSANASKYSIGRGYARALGLDENSALFTAVSGSADAALVMTLDPTLFLGKANKLWRTVKKGVQLTDLARIRWFAGGLREGGNILNMPIIEGVENIASVSKATSKIDSADRILKSVFGRSTLDNLEPLIDESGRVTDFAIDNYDEIHELLDDAKSVLLNQRIGYNKVIAEEAVDEGYNFAEAVYKGDLALLNEQLNGVEIAKQLMSRVPPNGDSIRTLGRTLSHARTKQAEKYNLWIETVNDVFKKLRVADQDERYIIVNELRRRLPKGNAVVTELLEYDAKLIQSGFAGLDDYDSVWDFIEANAMIWGSGRGTGQAVKGFGNGMKVRDSWRLFSDGSDLRLFDRNAYTSLPELTKAGVLLRKAVAKSERVIEETQRLKNFNLAFDRNITKVENFAIRFVSKPARMTAALAWNLTHHVPKSNGVMSLTGPDAVAEFEKFLNQGVFAGMKQKDRDIFMGKFLLGFGEDTVDRWIFNGTVAEGQASYNAWRELLNSPEGKKLVDKLREFSGTKINPNVPATSATPLQAIFHESGQLTEYGIKNFDELKAIVWDVFYRDLENMEPFTNPSVSLPKGIQIFNKQIEANSRSATLASRFLVERLFLEDLFQRTGMYDVPGGKEVVDRFLHQLTNTRYAPNDLDKVGLDEAAQRVALLPTAQYSDMISTPDFLQDIQANATKLSLLARTIRTTFNGDIIETAMSTYWKPITLLRLGFIPRAAGEEFLAFYARAGIWAPLALAATQSAADRRGLLTGIVNLPSKLTAKKFGQLSRAGLDDDLWKLSAMAPYRNVSDYIYSVARAAHKKPTDLNRYDYLGLYSAYWTGSVARSAKQLQFKLLPEILQTGIMGSMTQKNQNWIKEGLVTLDGLSDAVRLSADAAIRDPYFQRGIAAAHEESGRTAMFNPADEDLGTNDISVRKGIYGTETEKVTVQLLHEYEPISNYDEATAVEISYTYSQADQEIVLKPVIEHFAGAVDESTLDGAIAPMFRDTEYAVPFAVIEPEEVFQPFVADDFGFDIDLIDPNDLNRGAIGNEAPDLLDRYVETLKVRADSLPVETTTTLDEAGNQVILSNRTPEFTTEAEVTLDDLEGLDPNLSGMQDPKNIDIPEALDDAVTGQPFEGVFYRGVGANYGDKSVLGPGLYVTPRRNYARVFATDFSGDEKKFIGQIVEQPISIKNPLVVDGVDDWKALAKAAGLDGDSLDEGDNLKLRAYIESLGHDGVVVRWKGGTDFRSSTAPRGSRGLIETFGDIQAVAFNTAEQVPPSGTLFSSSMQEQLEATYANTVAQLSDKDLLTLVTQNILAEQNLASSDIRVGIVAAEWERRQALKKFQPEQIQERLQELQLEGKLQDEPFNFKTQPSDELSNLEDNNNDIFDRFGERDYEYSYEPDTFDIELLVPKRDVAKKAYNIPARAISRANIVDDLRRLAGDELGPRSTPDRSIWFNSEVLDSSDEAESLRALAEVIFQRGYVEPPIAEAIGSASRMATEDIVASANRFRESVLNLPSKDLRLLYEWIQGSGSVPNRSNVMPDWEALGLLGADSVLTPDMKEMLKASQTNSSFHVLVQRALTDKMQMGDSRLFDIIDILSKTDSPRYRQVLIGDTPIRSIKREQLITEAKPILLAALNDPNVSKQVRGNRRYLVNSKTAKNLAIPTGDNVQPIYYVMAGGALNEDLIRMFSTFTDKEYYQMLEEVSEAGYGPEILDSIDQIINNLNSDSLKALLEAAEVRGGDMLPVGSVGFIDYDHAREVSDALEIVLNTIDTYPAGESLRTIRVGASAAPKNANVILPLPPTGRQTYGYAYQSRDDGLLWGARPLDPNDIRRFDDGGNLDDFGNHVIEGGTIDENLDAWADTLNQFVNDIFFSQRGDVLHEVIEPMRRGTFAVDAAAQIPSTDLPAGLYRPKKFIVEPETNWVTKAARFGFGKIINPAIFALVRHPMYLLAFSNGYEFARVNNIVFRSKRLDQFAEIWAKNNKADLNELRNIWAMIPEERRAGIYSIDQLKDQMMELAFDGKLNMDSPYVQLIDDVGVAFMSKEQRGDISSLIDWVKMDQNVERINTRVAMDRAMEEMVPYIDDHQVRSFFQEYARNIMPFEFAQEQFLKRWARTLSYSPEGFRRVQLLAHAFTTNGFIQEQNGEKYLVIPGTESLNSLIATLPVLDGLFGGSIRLPTAVPMGLNTRNILPGIPNDLENLPAFSPVAMLGVEQLSNHFPEIKTIAQQFNGGRPIESDDNLIDAFVDFIPQNYQRLYAGLARNNLPLPKGIEGEYTRNVMAAVQQAAAEAERLKAEQRQLVLLGKEQEAADMQRRINQLQPPIGSTKQQEEEWLDTIKDWTRANMFVRGALGFVMPTTSQNLFEGKELSGEFGVLLGQMDFDTALATFLAEHPDGAAYTIFATKKTSKAPIPTTEKAINWMRNNQGWMKAYPKAAPWLIPQQKSTDVHSPQAYSDAIGMGIRNMKDINEWYADFKFAAGANRYFPTKEAFDLAKSQAKTSAERSLLEAQWQAESEIIKKQHPIFSEKLQSMVSTDADLTMQELRNILALPDSELPDVEQIDGLREAVGSWDVYVSEYSLLAGKNSKAARAKREDLKIRFIAYGKDLVLRYPEMRTFWNSIVLSSLDLVSKKKILESGEL